MLPTRPWKGCDYGGGCSRSDSFEYSCDCDSNRDRKMFQFEVSEIPRKRRMGGLMNVQSFLHYKSFGRGGYEGI